MEAYVYEVALPDHIDGFYDFETHSIFVDYRVSSATRRCTIAHERLHAVDHDRPIADPWLHRKRERLVEQRAARHLIAVDKLAEAIQWASDMVSIAYELDVDLVTLQARLDTLTAYERDFLEQIAARRDY